MIQFTQNSCQDLNAALNRNWLEANGMGGFASATIIGLYTCRYHGWLTAAITPPAGRDLLLSKLEDVSNGERRVELAAKPMPWRQPSAVHASVVTLVVARHLIPQEVELRLSIAPAFDLVMTCERRQSCMTRRRS